jgi:hypothetical protein
MKTLHMNSFTNDSFSNPNSVSTQQELVDLLLDLNNFSVFKADDYLSFDLLKYLYNSSKSRYLLLISHSAIIYSTNLASLQDIGMT